MTVSLKHAFTSPVVDLGNPNEVGPDEWNAEHTLTMAADLLLGRLSTDGAVQELTAAQVKTLLAISGGDLVGLGSGVATWLGTPSSANLAAAVTDETGSGALVFANSPTLVTPALGTPSSVTLTNGTGLPIATGVAGLGTGVATALAVNTGSAGAVVLFDGAGGTPSALTLTNATGLPIATGVSGLAAGIATFLATPSSANLRTAVTDETGSGALVFGTSPALTTPNIGTPSAGVLTSCTGLPLTTGVTGTLAVANGGTGDTGTAWATSTPTPTAGTGTFTSVSAALRWKTIGKTAFFQLTITITTNGTAATSIIVPLPSNAAAVFVEKGRNQSTGAAIVGTTGAGSANLTIVTDAGAYPGADSTTLVVSGTLEIQ